MDCVVMATFIFRYWNRTENWPLIVSAFEPRSGCDDEILADISAVCKSKAFARPVSTKYVLPCKSASRNGSNEHYQVFCKFRSHKSFSKVVCLLANTVSTPDQYEELLKDLPLFHCPVMKK